MTPVDPRTLKPGQRVRWTRTVEGIVGDVEHAWAGEGYVATVDVDDEYGDRHSVMVFSGRHGMDVFDLLVPPLPTEIGKTIVARLSDVGIPRVLALGLKNGQPAWFIAGASECTDTVDPEDITEWALLDGVHTVRDPEPPCPFADEHERWGLTTARAGEPGTSRDGVDGTLVECPHCGPGHLLLDPDEEQYGSEPAREERPCEGCDNHISGCLTPCPPLPTGLGAVVRAHVGGKTDIQTLVRADTDDEPWRESVFGRWLSDDRITVVEVLHPGIEVPS